jgi:hypothetical protein
VRSIKSRMMKLEKMRGKGGLKFCFLTLYKGEDEPEIKDMEVFRMIIRLDRHRTADC